MKITRHLSAKKTVEIHESLEEHVREVLTIDNMPDSPKIWLNLNAAMAIQVLQEQVVVYYSPNVRYEVYELDEIARIQEYLQIASGDNEEDGWEDVTE